MTTPPEALREALAHLDRLALAHANALVAYAQAPNDLKREAYDALNAAHGRLNKAAEAVASLP